MIPLYDVADSDINSNFKMLYREIESLKNHVATLQTAQKTMGNDLFSILKINQNELFSILKINQNELFSILKINDFALKNIEKEAAICKKMERNCEKRQEKLKGYIKLLSQNPIQEGV